MSKDEKDFTLQMFFVVVVFFQVLHKVSLSWVNFKDNPFLCSPPSLVYMIDR